MAIAGKGGLGFGGKSAPKAMTSSMLASATSGSKGGLQMTFNKAVGGGHKTAPAPQLPQAQAPVPRAQGGSIPGNTAANPYIEGQGIQKKSNDSILIEDICLY
jgi:hypothetical protein